MWASSRAIRIPKGTFRFVVKDVENFILGYAFGITTDLLVIETNAIQTISLGPLFDSRICSGWKGVEKTNRRRLRQHTKTKIGYHPADKPVINHR